MIAGERSFSTTRESCRLSPGYFEIISGVKRGPLAGVTRLGLGLLSAFYGVAVGLRNCAYDLGILRTERVEVPVVSLGNLTTGGTGKTPVAAALAVRFLKSGLKPAIISRGYRADASGKNDESRVLEILVPEALQVQNPDRVKGANQAIKEGGTVVLLDDGYQHRRLHRDFNFLLIDAIEPFGYERLLPRGLLRESLRGVRRADLVLVTRADLVSDDRLSEIGARLNRSGCRAPVMHVAFEPTRLISHSGSDLTLAQLADKKVLAFCGIGNPEGFRQTLAPLVGELPQQQRMVFPDHHHYSERDCAEIVRQARDCGADVLVTTLKDLVKIHRDELEGLKLYALETGLRILSGEEHWNEMISRVQELTRIANPKKDVAHRPC